MQQSDIPGISGGSTDNSTVYCDIGHSLLAIGSAGNDLSALSKDLGITKSQSEAKLDKMVTTVTDNISALQKDQPTDSKLQSILNDYLNALKQTQTVFTDFQQAAQQENFELLQTAEQLAGPMGTSLDNVSKEIQDYTPPSN